MKRVVSVFLFAAAAAALLASCRDQPNLTSPVEIIVPMMEVVDVAQVDLLIGYLYPDPGLRRSADRRWNNIQRQKDRDLSAAQEQAMEMVSDAMILLENHQLNEGDFFIGGDPEIYVSGALEGVNLLADWLFAFTLLEEVPEFDQEYLLATDKGSGTITPDGGGTVTTENGWARLTVEPGATTQNVFITIQLIDDATCDADDQLKTALGCWDFDQFGGGSFERTVEVCVADPGLDVLTDEEYYDRLRVHEEDEETGTIVGLPFVESTLDCSSFPLEPPPPAGVATEHSVLGSVGSLLSDFLMPEPLGAFLQDVRRPPRGIGGVTGSFTWFYGAVPADYGDISTDPAPYAESWLMEAPPEAVVLCREPGLIGCPEDTEQTVTVSAVATGSIGDPTPWSTVYFYAKPQGASGPVTPIGLTSSPAITDDLSNRHWTWALALTGDKVPLRGAIDVFAIGVAGGGSGIVATDLNPNIFVLANQISLWSADGDYTDTYGGNDGTAVGSVPFGSGVQGSGFDLRENGNEVYVQPLSEEVRDLQELTIATWVYLDPDGPPDHIQRFVTLGREKAVLRQEGVPGATNRELHFYMHFEPTPIPDDGFNLYHIWVDNAFQSGCYQFFVGTFDGDVMRAYLDGTEVGDQTVTDGPVARGYDFAKFGSSGPAGIPGEELEGLMDEVMIFDRALTPEEIQTLYDMVAPNGKCGPAPTFDLSGTVKLNGLPVPSATVVSLVDLGGGGPVRTAMTDLEGSYSFTNLPAGEYIVSPGSPSGLSRVVKSTNEDRTVNFDVLSGTGSATIDGVVDGGEWDGAGCRSYLARASNLVGEDQYETSTHDAELCVMNDADSLYVRVAVDRSPDPWSFFNLTIRDPDFGVDDVVRVGLPTDQVFGDGFWTGGSSIQQDNLADPPGTLDGSGAVTRNGRTIFELSHPLDSGDAYDINGVPGQAFDIHFSLWLCAEGGTGGWCSASGLPGVSPPGAILTLLLS